MKHLKEIYSPGKHKLVQSVRHTLGISGRYGGADTSQDFEDEANRQGYRQKILGSGVMGSVIDRDSEHPAKKNQVYKIFKDPAYHSFAKMAHEKSSENPHYPKIHALGKLKGTSVGVARLEKLKELHDVHPMRDVLGGFTNPFRNVNGASVSMRLEHHPIGQELKQRYPEFHKALSEIAEKHPNHRFDLHMGNIMQRGEGPHATPVITDPIIKQDENDDFVASDEKEKEQTHTKTFASNIPKVKKFEFGDHLSSIPQMTFKQKTGGHWALTRKKDSAGLKPKSPNSSELTHPPTLREDGGAPTAAPTNNAGSGAIAGLDNNPPVRKKQPILRRKRPEIV